VRAGQDIALRDIVRVVFDDGERAIGKVVALYEADPKPLRATVETPRGDWSGLAAQVVVVRTDETNRMWRDGWTSEWTVGGY
jgi:hypothetical protein